MNCSKPGFPVLHCLPDFPQIHVHWVSNAIQPSHLCHPRLLLPSIFLSIRVFSSESALCKRWSKYWNFSFNISPFNEYLRLISFKIDWFDILLSKGHSKVFSSTTVWKHEFLSTQPSLRSNSHILTWLLEN